MGLSCLNARMRLELEMWLLDNHLLHRLFGQVFRVEVSDLSSSPLGFGLKARSNDNTLKQTSSYICIVKRLYWLISSSF